MSDDSIEAKALALVNEVSDERAIPRWTTFYRKENGFVEALCRAIEQHEATKLENEELRHDLERHMLIADEQHETLAAEKEQLRHDLERQMTIANERVDELEAFKQEVSDAAEQYNEAAAPMGWEGFDRFIIPKPDPLVEVLLEELAWDEGAVDEYAGHIRAALEARGFEIREKGQ